MVDMVDFEKGFDNITRKKLYIVLLKLGVLKNLVKMVTVCMKLQGTVIEETDPFQTGSGDKQGDGLLPLLFCVVVEGMVQGMFKGIAVTRSLEIQVLLYI